LPHEPAPEIQARAPAARQNRTGATQAVGDFQELADFLNGAAAARLDPGARICIVTNEMVAFHKNGGLGTATSGMIETLALRGLKLSVIYTAPLDLNADYVRRAIADIRLRGIDFTCLQDSIPAEWMSSPRKLSYACYWLLRRQEPAIIHFNDYLGNGFYTAQARYTGTALPRSIVIVTVHGPTRWALSIDERPMATADQQEICFLEERTLEFADVVLGVSHHLLQWLKREGVQLPKHSYVHKNIMPVVNDARLPRRLLPGQLSEVVFFARQDVRKGFLIMLAAIRALSATLPQLKFTFLGKFSNIAGEHSGAMALDELRSVPNLIDFRHSFDRNAALRYLRRHGVLAVIPSMDENSPCTVFECIVEGIPFIASAVGGIPELVAPANHASVLFAPTAAALAAKIQEVAEVGVDEVALAFDPPAIADQMVDGFAALYAQIMQEREARDAAMADQTPLVSVVVTHFNRHQLLKPLLAALENQTYPNFEVVVIDDGSTKVASIAYINTLQDAKFRYKLKVFRTKNQYLGAARNAGVAHAEGVFIKFQDDDNLPLPHEIEYFVRAAMTANADIVTGMSRFFTDESETETEMDLAGFQYFPLGASLPLALTHNEYGDANALVRRASFLEDGGFTEHYGVGSEDYEFFVKSESLGRRIVFVPEPLFNYRVSDSSMLQTTSAYRGAKRARAGLQASNQRWLKDLIIFSHESALARDIAHQAWYRAGKRQFCDLHRQMMEGSPENPDNINRFLDLAARYGRLEDVIHMVLSQNTLFDSLKWLEGNAKRYEDSPTTVREFLTTRPRILKFSSFTDIKLLQPTENLPVGWSIFRIEPNGMLVHPLSGRITQVLVPKALPVNTKKVTVKFSHRNPQGGTVRMGFNIVADGLTLVESGWVEVLPNSEVQAAVVIDLATDTDTDLVLLSTIEGPQDFAWAFADHVCIELDKVQR
jgi:glycosyltransferase involved in cell wall biosynthesis